VLACIPLGFGGNGSNTLGLPASRILRLLGPPHVPIRRLSRSHPYQSTVPTNPCAPHARPGPFSPNTNGAARALFWTLPAECRQRRESLRQAVMPVVDANTMF
jgi:hypothetical protein